MVTTIPQLWFKKTTKNQTELNASLSTGTEEMTTNKRK